MTKDDLIHAAIVSGVVDEAAVNDAESYDGYLSLRRLDVMWELLRVHEPRGECICPTCGIRHGGSNVDGGF